MAVGWERVSTLAELRASGGRALARLASGRGVALFLQQQAAASSSSPSSSSSSSPPAPLPPRVFALDHACYHHGGPLVDGDIEDVPGVGACVLCPWHKYRIALASGEGFYVGVNVGGAGGGGGPPREELKSKGLRQRAHACRLVPLPGGGGGGGGGGGSGGGVEASASVVAFSGVVEDAGAEAGDDEAADAAAAAADAAFALVTSSAAYAGAGAGADADAAVEVLDMGAVPSALAAARLGGAAALRLFREQRLGAGAAAAAAALVLSGAAAPGAAGSAAGSAAAPPSAAMAAAVRAQAASQLSQSDGYARKPFNAVGVSCRGEAGGDDGGGFNAGRAPAMPLHSSARDLRPPPVAR